MIKRKTFVWMNIEFDFMKIVFSKYYFYFQIWLRKNSFTFKYFFNQIIKQLYCFLNPKHKSVFNCFEDFFPDHYYFDIKDYPVQIIIIRVVFFRQS